MDRNSTASRSQPHKAIPGPDPFIAPEKPKLTIVRDAQPTDKGFIGHFDQVLVRDSKGAESLVQRSAVA